MENLPVVTVLPELKKIEVGGDKFQLAVIIFDKLIYLVDKLTLLFNSAKSFLSELRINRIVESVDLVNELIIHKTLMRELKALGLGRDWLRLVLDEKDSMIWLKNVKGAYVAVNNKLFKELGLSNYSQIVGRTSKEVSLIISDDNKYKNIMNMADVTDTLVNDFGSGLLNVTSLDELQSENKEVDNLSILKYVLKGKDGDTIAIFGIARFATNEDVSLKTVENPEQYLVNFLKVLDTNMEIWD